MPLAILYSRAISGMEAPLVTVEVHIANGLPSFTIVGLPEAEVKESKDRVRAALQNAQFEFPARRITVNLAPADLPKESGRFDLPIALGILAATGQIPSDKLDRYEWAGELALTGELRAIRGALAMTYGASRSGSSFVLPQQNAAEAALVKEAAVYPATSLLADLRTPCRARAVAAFTPGIEPGAGTESDAYVSPYPGMEEVKGQAHAKRALEIAAAGGHSVLMVGPPGTGKSMLAARLPGILPSMTEEEALESAAMQSLSSSGFNVANWKRRPYRSPHHTASGVALVGGGSNPRPGEISLAMNGVLFLDELPEFDRKVLEVLREPLESGRITISRAARQADFPARFQLIAAMNPVPLRLPRTLQREMPLQPRPGSALPRQNFGPGARSHRYTDRGSRRAAGRFDAPGARRIEQHDQASGSNWRISANWHGKARPTPRLAVKDIDKYCMPDDAGESLLKASYQPPEFFRTSLSSCPERWRALSPISRQATA